MNRELNSNGRYPDANKEKNADITPMSILDLLNKNLSLKYRIQGTSWYRDFFSGKMPKDIFYQLLGEAQAVENILSHHPEIISSIQNNPIWSRYLSGEISPGEMINTHIEHILYVHEFEKNNPEVYLKIQQNPLWIRTLSQDKENDPIMGQESIITSVSMRLQQLQDEPGLMSELSRFGFSEQNIFTDNWEMAQGIYGAIDSIRNIISLDSGKKQLFLDSHIGQQYIAGRVDWIELQAFLEQ